MIAAILAGAAATNNNVTVFSQGGTTLTLEYGIPIFVAMVFASALFSSKTKIPHTMILLGFGISISLLGLAGSDVVNFSHFKINPNLVITFIIPPLIFEAMMKVDYKQFKAIRISALLLATIGVVLATLIGGFLLVYIAGLPFLVAFAFAALISPTDAAIVIEIFKRVKVPRVLSTLMESEAAFNDATGAIAFSSIIALAVSSSGYAIFGTANSGFPTISNDFINLSFIAPAEHFIILFFGGAAIGLAIATVTHRLHTLMNDPLSETSLTIATVFGSVVLANSLGVSGLAAVAVAGLYFGNVTIKKEATMSKSVRTFAFNFWEMIAFLASSAAFLYLGISMNLVDIVQHFPIIALSLIAVFGARAATTYPLLAATTRFAREKIPNTWKHIVLVGGMRGAISVALVASLPPSDFKNILQTITFGVVLLSLIIQYVVLSRYVKRVFPDVQ
ncbi:MAG: sodium:proton antiporter [Thermoproteota archaeon]|nr:sodium:proton antiporter [Thermoproteota archaeon]